MSAPVERAAFEPHPDQIDLEDAIAASRLVLVLVSEQTPAKAVVPARRKTSRVLRDARASVKRSTERSVRCERVRAGAIAKGMSLGYIRGLTTDALAAWVAMGQCKERLAKAQQGGK